MSKILKKINHFKSFKKKSGTLIPFSLKKDIPFNVKRIFLIYGKKNFIRGNHAHKKCSQFILPIHGKIEIQYEGKNFKNIKKLDYKKKESCYLKPLTWCRIKFLTNNSVIMVFCNREYEYKDYIENYKLFKKSISKKK
jgi:dTDP-4-dehydrorhamnose 3,5-epimerase-like enzyme